MNINAGGALILAVLFIAACAFIWYRWQQYKERKHD